MKAYICDQCGRQQEPDKHYDLPPKEWFDLRKAQSGKTEHFCGLDCLLMNVQQKVGDRALAPIAPPSSAPDPIYAKQTTAEPKFDEGIVAGENYHG